MRRGNLLLLVCAGMSLCLLFSQLFRQTQPVPPTGISGQGSFVGRNGVPLTVGPVLAEIPPETQASRVPVESDHIFATGSVVHSRIEIGDETTILVVRDHPAPLAVVVDVLKMVRTGNTTYNLALRPGDTIWVPDERGKE